jgi:protein-S-isoprenylcysteine O-methyltransferase Ste14
MIDLLLFQSACLASIALFLWYGMDVRRKAGARDFVPPFWQALMSVAALSLLGAFIWVVLAIREPAGLDWLGLALMGSGTSFVVAAKRALGPMHTFTGQYREHPRLVTSGVYAVTRNPLYFGVFQCELGALLCAVRQVPALLPRAYPYWFAAFGLALAYAVSFNWIMARREAHQLERQCGDTYRQYRSHVPFLIPSTRSHSEVQ